jgi:hypothetical protein
VRRHTPRPTIVVLTLTLALAMAGCASQWKILGGPPECRAMCEGWGLEFAGMVGVGNQDAVNLRNEGATACICLVPKVTKGAVAGAGGASASLSGPVVAATQAAVAAVDERARQRRVPHR